MRKFKIIPEDGNTYIIAIICIGVSLLMLTRDYFIYRTQLISLLRPPTETEYPYLSFIIMPFIFLIIAISGIIREYSFLGLISTIISFITFIVGKNILPIVYKIISKSM